MIEADQASWLQTTLSYISDDDERQELEHELLEGRDETQDNDVYQMQVTKLTTLVSRIFQRIPKTENFLETIRVVRHSLSQWLEAVPDSMRVRGQDEKASSPAARVPQLYLHSFYLGSQMLVYRWTLSWFLQRQQSADDISQELRRESFRCVEDGILAAKESAAVLHTLYSEGAAVRHCWLCM